MFYEYAIDPEIFSSLTSCETFFNNFLTKSQRLISDTPRKWQYQVFQKIDAIPHEQCKPVMKKTLKHHLKNLMKENLVKNRGITGDAALWLDLASQEHSRYPYAAIYTNGEVKELPGSYEFNNLLYVSPPAWNCSTQEHVLRKAQNIVDAAKPLLAVSKEVHVIDRYFTPYMNKWSQYKNVLVELFCALEEANFGNGIARLNIHASDEWTISDENIPDTLDAVIPEGFIVNIYQWPRGDMHARFILSDIGGIKYDHGLDERTDGREQTTLAIALDNAAYKTERAKISGTPVDKTTISKQ